VVEQELVGDGGRVSSVVTPGAMAAAAVAIAWAAIVPATRILAMVSASLTSEPVNGFGAGRSTYSGRAIPAGTGRRAEIEPGDTWARVSGIRLSLGIRTGRPE
jgi:hypothetical protein